MRAKNIQFSSKIRKNKLIGLQQKESNFQGIYEQDLIQEEN